MKIVGYRLEEDVGPVKRAFLPLADLTVLLGPNDSGKTRLLDSMVEWLRTGRDFANPTRAGLLLELSEQEAEALFEQALVEKLDDGSNAGGSDDASAWPLLRTLTEHPAALHAALNTTLEDLKLTRREMWLSFLREAVVTPENDATWDPIFDSLAGSSIFELALSGNAKNPWDIKWCIENPGAVLDSGSNDSGDSSVGNEPWPSHADMPEPVAPVLRLSLPLAPVPLVVPVPFGDLTDAVEGAITDVVVSLAKREAVQDLDEAELLKDAKDHSPYDVWFETIGDERLGIRVREDVIAVCGYLMKVIAKTLPSFVGHTYEVIVAPRPPREWPNAPLAQLVILDKSSNTHFSCDEIAQGYQIWLQLAIQEAVDTLRLRLVLLLVTFDELRSELRLLSQAQEVLDLPDVEPSHPFVQLVKEVHEDATIRVNEVKDEYIMAVDSFRQGFVSAEPTGLDPDELAARWLQWHELYDDSEMVNTISSRLYVIDEPERHLHPRLQREAAQWLADTMRLRRSQCVVATHSVPFLNLGPDVSYAFLRRNGQESHVEPFVPEHLTRLNSIAAGMGFDRGELLANVAILMFVEGRADQVVVEALFGRMLRQAGIAVFPVQGVGRHGQILDSDILLRYTAAQIVVLFDNLAIEEVLRLKRNPEALNQALKSRKTELNAMAQLVKNAQIRHRPIEPFGLPVKDIFDVLDEGVLKEQFPLFPGHRRAQLAYAESHPKGRVSRKQFYEQLYGVTNSVEMYARTADAMAAQGLVPLVVQEVLLNVERLAFARPQRDE